MKKKYICIMSFVLSIMMLLAGCTSPAENLMNDVKSNADVEKNELNKELKTAVMKFSWDLFKESSKKSENIMISPASAYLALGMTINGADNDTKKAIMDTLSAEDISLEQLNKGLSSWSKYLSSDNKDIQLSIANSIWLRSGFEADEKFLQSNADYYKASVKALDFTDKRSVNEINKWVKKATNGTIEKMTDKIDNDVMMYLINAVYFKGEWKDKFKAYDSYEQPFNTKDGVVNTDFMHRKGEINYFNDGSTQGVILPYKGERFAFVAILPEKDQTPKDFIEKFSAAKIFNFISSKKYTTIELALPKFECSYEDSLVDKLTNMGMKDAFDPNNADFSLMKKDHTKGLYISDIKHKTYIKVDEEGSEASAVTSVEIDESACIADVKKVVFDRPFIYGIVDVKNGLLLFMGVMENPTE